MATATLSYNLNDLIGEDFDPRRTKVWITANVPLIVVDGTTIRLDNAPSQSPASDGTGSFSLVTTNSAVNPTSFAYVFHVDYALKGRQGNREQWHSSEFTFTASANIAAISEAFDGLAIAPTWQSEFRAEMEAIRDDVVDISGISTSDGVVSAMVAGTAGAGPLTRAALSATYGVTLAGSGIDPTGATDSTAAIQAKLNSAAVAGVPVVSSPGAVYRLGSALTIPDGLRWQGRGATLKASPGAAHHLMVASSVSDVQIEGLTLDLNRGNVTAPGSEFGLDAIGIYVYTSSEGLVLRDVTIENGHQYGLRIGTGVPDALIEVTLDNVAATGCSFGAYIDGGTNVAVQGGRFDRNRQDGLCLNAGVGHRIVGVQANVNARHGIVADGAASHFTITGCVANDNGTGTETPDGAGIVTSVNVNHFTITGNVCQGNKASGIQIDTNNGSEVQVDTYGVVTGNLCSGSLNFHGIYLTYARFMTVTGNVCHYNAFAGIMAVSSNAVITGNQLLDNAVAGLYLGYSVGTAPNMGGHTIGDNVLLGNGSEVLISGGGNETPSSFHNRIIPISTAVNLNTLTAPGQWLITGTQTNGPGIGSGILTTHRGMSGSDEFLTQEFYAVDTGVVSRRWAFGGTFNAWHKTNADT